MLNLIKLLIFLFTSLIYSQSVDYCLKLAKEIPTSKIREQIKSKNEHIYFKGKNYNTKEFELYQYAIIGQCSTAILYRVFGSRNQYKMIKKTISKHNCYEKNKIDSTITKIEQKQIDDYNFKIQNYLSQNNYKEKIKYICLDGSSVAIDVIKGVKPSDDISLSSSNCRRKDEKAIKLENIFKSIFIEKQTTHNTIYSK